MDDNFNWNQAFQEYTKIVAGNNELLQAKATIKLADLSNQVPLSILQNAIPILSNLLSTHYNSSVQESAAYCLRRLAVVHDGQLCLGIARSRAVPLLLQLLPDSNDRFQRTLLRCIRAIVDFDNRSRGIVVRHGSVEIFSRLMRTCTDDNRRYVLESLSALAMVGEGREYLRNHHGLSLLVEAVSSGSLRSRTRAAQAVGLLGRARAVRHTLVEKGAISALIGLLRDGDTTAKLVAGNALGVISSHVDYIRPVAQAGSIPMYAELLEGDDPVGKEIAEDVFCILAVAEENASLVMEHLVRILEGDKEEAKAAAIDVLWDLAGYDHSACAMRDLGAVPLLINFLQAEDDNMKEKAAGAIAQLSSDEANRRSLAGAGAISILTRLLRDGTEDVKEFAVEALMCFEEDPLFRDELSEALSIPSFQAIRDRLMRIRSSDSHMSRSMRELSVGHLASNLELF